MKKKEIVENLGQDIAYLVHVGLRKWTDHPASSKAWKGIALMDDGSWEDLCKIVANEIYTPMRKAFKKQFKP